MAGTLLTLSSAPASAHAILRKLLLFLVLDRRACSDSSLKCVFVSNWCSLFLTPTGRRHDFRMARCISATITQCSTTTIVGITSLTISGWISRCKHYSAHVCRAVRVLRAWSTAAPAGLRPTQMASVSFAGCHIETFAEVLFLLQSLTKTRWAETSSVPEPSIINRR